MKLIYKGEEIGYIITNHSFTIEEAIYALGYDVNDPEDCRKAYKNGFIAAYMDDFGNCCIDTENIEMCYKQNYYINYKSDDLIMIDERTLEAAERGENEYNPDDFMYYCEAYSLEDAIDRRLSDELLDDYERDHP